MPQAENEERHGQRTPVLETIGHERMGDASEKQRAGRCH